jgi:hypothetical protein
MGIRMLCLLACFFVQGWWLAVAIAGALVLPYIAVVLANSKTTAESTVLRPGGLVPTRSPSSSAEE